MVAKLELMPADLLLILRIAGLQSFKVANRCRVYFIRR